MTGRLIGLGMAALLLAGALAPAPAAAQAPLLFHGAEHARSIQLGLTHLSAAVSGSAASGRPVTVMAAIESNEALWSMPEVGLLVRALRQHQLNLDHPLIAAFPELTGVLRLLESMPADMLPVRDLASALSAGTASGFAWRACQTDPLVPGMFGALEEAGSLLSARPPVRVLSVDGGGTRGIVSARVLAEMEARTGKPISDMFDVMVGTSTGGLIVLGLTKPGPDGRPAFSAEEMIELYREGSPRIFTKGRGTGLQLILGGAKYSSAGIESVLAESFGDARLSEATSTAIIPSYDILGRRPFYFSSRLHDYYMRDVARGATAAPTYFDPFVLAGRGAEAERRLVLIDAIFETNPAMRALAEARTLFPNADDVILVSIGTRPERASLDLSDTLRLGLAGWTRHTLNFTLDGQSQSVHDELTRLLPPIGNRQRYFRFHATVPKGKMDDATVANLDELHSVSEKLVESETGTIDQACANLSGCAE